MTRSDADILIDGLIGFLDAIEVNRPLVIAGDGGEALHDLRVGVRRSRSALKHAKGVIRGKARHGFAEEFSWLQDVTGPARDLEVWLAALDADDPLRFVLAAHHDTARHTAIEALASKRTARLVNRWSRELERARRDRHLDADKRIERQHHRVLGAAEKAAVDAPAADLHRLRKRGKELRYLLELFPSDDRRPLRKALKQLQDALGEVQDAEVQRAWLVAHEAELGLIDVRVKELDERDAVARMKAIEQLARFTAIPLA